METNLRQANAKVSVAGVVSEIDLKPEVKDGKNVIKGSLTVQTSADNFVRFNVMVNETTKNGDTNKTYAGIQTVMNEYKSIAKVGVDDADRVFVNGDLNIFTGQNGTSVGYKSNFFNRAKSLEDFEPKAEFSVEVYITQIVPEIKNDEETGRVLVKGWVPTYNLIEPITLVAPKEIAGAIDSTFAPGQTAEFYGDCINSRVEKVTEIPVAIGKPRKKVETSYVNVLVIPGASEPYEEGVSKEKPYDADTIQAAIREREAALAEAANKAANAAKANTKPSGAKAGRTLGF